MMSELIIKTQEDLNKHFNFHYEKESKFFGEFQIDYDEISMYYGQEGSVMTNISYCPYCGIKLTLQTNHDNGVEK